MSRPIARRVKRGQTLPRTRYELPPEGISLLGFAVRRMHKTARLLPVPELLRAGRSAEALAQVALYAAEASSSFGPAYHRPQPNVCGAALTEADPLTGAPVSATLAETTPHLRLDCRVRVAGVGTLAGREIIERTGFSLSGLTMACRMEFKFTARGLS